MPDNVRYLTIRENCVVVYDSRQDVPCDMTAWLVTRENIQKRRILMPNG
jgi:hypothetical protein